MTESSPLVLITTAGRLPALRRLFCLLLAAVLTVETTGVSMAASWDSGQRPPLTSLDQLTREALQLQPLWQRVSTSTRAFSLRRDTGQQVRTPIWNKKPSRFRFDWSADGEKLIQRWKKTIEYGGLFVKTILLFGGAIVIVDTLLSRQPVIIDPINVPESFKQLGYSPEVFQRKVVDQVQSIEQSVQSLRVRRVFTKKNDPVPEIRIPIPPKVDFTIPEVGMSYQKVLEQSQKVLHREPAHIGGELAFDTKDFSQVTNGHQFILTLRQQDGRSWPNRSIGADNVKNLIYEVGKQALRESDPHTLALFMYYSEHNYEAAEDLMADLYNDSTRPKWAYLLLGDIYANTGQLSNFALLDYVKAFAFYKTAIEKDPSDPDGDYRIGLALQERNSVGDLAEAIKNYRVALKKNPKLAVVYDNIGVAFDDKKNSDEAIKNYRKAIDVDPKDETAYYNLGTDFLHKRNFEEAIKNLLKAVELDPTHAEAITNLGTALGEKNTAGDLQAAIPLFRKAIALNPKLAEAYDNLGWALARRNEPRDLEESISNGRKAIALNPKLVEAYDNLAYALARRNNPADLQEIITIYGKAIELDPKHATAYYNIGVTWDDAGDVDKAVVNYRKAIELDPKLQAVYLNLGKALYRKGQLDDSIKQLRKAIELDPKDESAYNNLGFSFEGQGNHDAAIANYQKAIELNPKDAMVYNNLGNSLDKKGNREEAIKTYRKAIEVNSRYKLAYFNLGTALMRRNATGDYGEALLNFQKAISVDHSYADAYYYLGFLYTERNKEGDPDRAILNFNKVIDVNPKYAEAYYYLGNVFMTKGNFDEAINAYRKTIELVPNNSDIHNALGWSLYKAGHFDEALSESKKAVTLNQNNFAAHDSLANVLKAKGDLAGAIKEFKLVIDQGQKNPETYYNYTLALRDSGQFDEALRIVREGIANFPSDASLNTLLADLQNRQHRKPTKKPTRRREAAMRSSPYLWRNSSDRKLLLAA